MGSGMLATWFILSMGSYDVYLLSFLIMAAEKDNVKIVKSYSCIIMRILTQKPRTQEMHFKLP
jgi:hypothetical protein